MVDQPTKICVVCGLDCAGQPRTKDAKGRYYHKDCHDRAERERDARRSADAVMLGEILPDAPPADTCPSCGHSLGASDVICTSCGYNTQSGRTLHVDVATQKPPREPNPHVGVATSILLSPFGVSMMVLATVVIVYFVILATGSPAAIQAWIIVLDSFFLITTVVVLVVAFREGIGQGLLTLCVPFYVIYFVFAVTDNQWAKWLFLVALVLRVSFLLLSMAN